MERFKNKYRIPSARAQWWDYGWNGAYYITICTRNQQHFFGEIRDGKMELSHLGVIVDILWHQIPHHASSVELGDFVVMPNHLHGILILDKPIGENDIDHGNDHDNDNENDNDQVDTGHALYLRHKRNQYHKQPRDQRTQQPSVGPANLPKIGKNRFQNIGKNTVSSIIGSYKSAVTKHANRLELENGWQRLFHDRIIRNDAEYQRISDYIIRNPSNWREGNFFPG